MNKFNNFKSEYMGVRIKDEIQINKLFYFEEFKIWDEIAPPEKKFLLTPEKNFSQTERAPPSGGGVLHKLPD